MVFDSELQHKEADTQASQDQESKMNTSSYSASQEGSITLSGSLSELMTIPILRNNFFAIVTQITICNFCFFFLVFILKSLKGNMVKNTLISYLT